MPLVLQAPFAWRMRDSIRRGLQPDSHAERARVGVALVLRAWHIARPPGARSQRGGALRAGRCRLRRPPERLRHAAAWARPTPVAHTQGAGTAVGFARAGLAAGCRAGALVSKAAGASLHCGARPAA